MICPQCGIATNQRLCPECGAPVEADDLREQKVAAGVAVPTPTLRPPSHRYHSHTTWRSLRPPFAKARSLPWKSRQTISWCC